MSYIRDTWYVPDEDEEIAVHDANYTDGTYEGVGTGIGINGQGGDVPVTVTIKDGTITDIEIGDNDETPDLGGLAIEYLRNKVIAANGTDGVNTVSSATLSSMGFLTAVKEALEKAGA